MIFSKRFLCGIEILLCCFLLGCSYNDVRFSNDSVSKIKIDEPINDTETLSKNIGESKVDESDFIESNDVVEKQASQEIFVIEKTQLLGLTSYGKELTSISIPSGITHIGGNRSGFRNAKVEELFISNSVKNIDFRAFQYCENLHTVKFEDGSKLKSYNDWFASDHNVDSLEFPEGLESIESSLNINSIKTLYIPSTVTSLPECLFDFDYYTAERSGIPVTKSVEIFTSGNNITSIGDFDDLSYIEEIIEHKDSSRWLFENLQKLLLPTYSDTVQYYTELNPDKLVKVILHCDKDSLLDEIFEDASWVTIKHNVDETIQDNSDL